MLDGLMSRCSTPRSWACCKASASRAPHQAIALGYVRLARAVRHRRRWPLGRRLEAVEARDELGSGPCRRHGRVGQGTRQGQAAEVRHAEQMEPGRRIRPIRVDRDDVSMLQSGQCLRLARAGGVTLSTTADRLTDAPRRGRPREGAPAQFLDQSEAGDCLARFRAADSQRVVDRAARPVLGALGPTDP